MGYVFTELWTFRTWANSAPVNSDPKKIDRSQFGPRPLVTSYLDHWSLRTIFHWSVRTSKIKILWSIPTFSVGQFGPFPLVNSDLFLWSIRTFFHWSIRTFALCVFHKENYGQIKNESSFLISCRAV